MKKYCIQLFALLNFSFIIYLWWYPKGDVFAGGILYALGRLSGLLAVFFVLTQFMMLGRPVWIEKVFGLDRLTQVHKWNGYLSLLFILLHSELIIFSYSKIYGRSVFSEYFIIFKTNAGTFSAFIASTLFIVIVCLSIYFVRRKVKYETWYYIHLLTYLAIYLAWGHQLKNGTDFYKSPLFVYYWYSLYIFVFINVLIFRFLKPLYLYQRYRFYIEKVVPETEDSTSIYIKGKNLQNFKIKPGQFLSLRVFTKKFWLQTHPFSLSKFPDGQSVRLTIRNSGDFTSQIRTIIPGTKVSLEGPFGVFTKEKAKKDKILLIAGGVGITPLRSLLEEFLLQKKDVILLYNSRKRDNIIFKDELEMLKKLYDYKLYHILSDDPTASDYLKGRIDKEKLEELVKDLHERDIFVCGPPPMIKAVRKDLSALGVHENQVHFEKFSFA